MIKYLKQYADKTFEELVNSLIWFDNPLKLKAIFAKLQSGFLTDAPIDGKQYARKDGEWDVVTSPVGGVQSVIGDLVDNTDPLNPVLNRGYKVFKAIITGPNQTDSISLMDILANNVYTGTAVWTRLNTGIYVLTLNGAFSGTLFSTGVSVVNASGNTNKTYISKFTNNEIYLYNFSDTGIRLDLLPNDKYCISFEIF